MSTYRSIDTNMPRYGIPVPRTAGQKHADDMHEAVNGLTKRELLNVLEHVPQHFWPHAPTRQRKADLVAAIRAAMRSGRYTYDLSHRRSLI